MCTKKILTEETKIKMSKAKLGKKLSIEHILAIKTGLTGRSLSEEHKQNISTARKGCRGFNKGKTFSDETKKNMSISAKKAWQKRREQ